MAEYAPGFEPYTPPSQPRATYVPGFEPYDAAQAAPAADEAMSIPTLSDAIAGFPSALNSGLKATREWMQPAANNLVNFAGDLASDFIHPGSAKIIGSPGPRGLFTGPSDETRATPTSSVGRLASEMVNQVPGNLTEAGGLLGTVALGPYGILSRILGGAGGAGIGQALEGGDAAAVGKAAGLGGVANVVGEGLASGLSLAAKSIPGAVTRIRHQDATRMLDAAPEVSAGLGRMSLEGRTSSEALQNLVQVGKTGLNDAKEEAVQRIEAALQTSPLMGPRGAMLDIPSLGPVSLREANAELTAIGEGLRHTQILDPTMRQREAGRAYAALSGEIRTALETQSPGLGGAFQEAQQAYSAGLDVLKQLAPRTNWTPGPGGIEFDARALQRDLAKDPLRAARTDQRMGDEGSDAFVNALTRGEGLGRVDRVPAGGGGVADALMEWLRGAKTGTASLPLALLRSATPNIGAQYIGRKPYTIDPGIRALMDMLGQRSMDQALGGTPVKIGPLP